jgi:hypothetical protein
MVGGGFPGGGSFPGGGGLPGGGGGKLPGPPKLPTPSPIAQPVQIEFTPEPAKPGAVSIELTPPVPGPPPVDEEGKLVAPTPSKPVAMAVQVKGVDKIEVLAGRAVVFEYIYGVLGLLIGVTAVILGAVMCLNGVVGNTSWTMKVLGAESQINDALPGVIFALIGFFLVRVTKPQVRLKR